MSVRKAIIVVGATCAVAYAGFVVWGRMPTLPVGMGTVAVCEAGVCAPVVTARATAGNILAVGGVAVGDNDHVWPGRDVSVGPGDVVMVARTRTVMLSEDRQKREVASDAPTVAGILADVGIAVGPDDEVIPAPYATVSGGGSITVVHTVVREETRTITIPFVTTEREDPNRKWGTETVITKGRKGKAEVTEKVVIKGGKEIRRTEISRKVIQEPEDREVVTGTKVTLGKKHTGRSSWYAFKGCDCAANPWLPKGSYAKVTNNANGKSVIVRINDRGPFVPGRIIDLDKVAFAKIASLGAGVIDVTMEEVK